NQFPASPSVPGVEIDPEVRRFDLRGESNKPVAACQNRKRQNLDRETKPSHVDAPAVGTQLVDRQPSDAAVGRIVRSPFVRWKRNAENFAVFEGLCTTQS